jgi:hypothetical protein
MMYDQSDNNMAVLNGIKTSAVRFFNAKYKTDMRQIENRVWKDTRYSKMLRTALHMYGAPERVQKVDLSRYKHGKQFIKLMKASGSFNRDVAANWLETLADERVMYARDLDTIAYALGINPWEHSSVEEQISLMLQLLETWYGNLKK